jgi:hypothetical protein
MEKLESQRRFAAPSMLRYGLVKKLAKDFTGERHVVILRRAPTDLPNVEWCHFEELPGPGPNEAEGAHILCYLSDADRRI